jgi:hypothetical protein
VAGVIVGRIGATVALLGLLFMAKRSTLPKAEKK